MGKLKKRKKMKTEKFDRIAHIEQYDTLMTPKEEKSSLAKTLKIIKPLVEELIQKNLLKKYPTTKAEINSLLVLNTLIYSTRNDIDKIAKIKELKLLDFLKNEADLIDENTPQFAQKIIDETKVLIEKRMNFFKGH